jgi:putative transposase
VSDHQAQYPIVTMCRLLGVSPSGWYAWVRRQPSRRAETDAALTVDIRAAHTASRGTYGAPRIHAELTANGIHVGRKRIARLMHQTGIAGVSRRKFITTTVKGDNRQAPDLVERNFTAEGPDRLWVADITYIPTWSGFLYLAVVLDAYSRRIVGWSMATTLATQLVLDALNMAVTTRRAKDVIHHSDQGSQYTSIAFGQRCRDAGVRPSMGSVGDAYDNAMCESFFATLECELLARNRFKTPAEARSAAFDFIEGFYNSRRRHSSIGYLSPIDFERRHYQTAIVVAGAPQAADVLTAVKDKPCGRPQEAAVLDRRCARRPQLRAGRDGRMAPPGAELKNVSTQEAGMPSNHTA